MKKHSRFARIRRTSLLVAMTCAMSSGSAFADPFSCSVFEKDSGKGKLLFTGKRTDRPGAPGSRELVANIAFQSPDGKEAVTEEAFYKDGKLSKYLLHQKQLGEEGALEVKDGKLLFSYTRGGKTETATEDAPADLIVGPTTVDHIHANWDKLMAGDDVDSRFAALDRRETVGFKFFKIEDKSVEGKAMVLIKMKPKSFVIAAIVKPLIFTFDKASKRLIELNGRALPKQNVNGKWKDLDGEITYKY